MMQDERQKIVKIRRSYDSDFKQEVIRVLASGRSAKDISEAFGIAENLLYRWKKNGNKKDKIEYRRK